jgi:hypothetical protein
VRSRGTRPTGRVVGSSRTRSRRTLTGTDGPAGLAADVTRGTVELTAQLTEFLAEFLELRQPPQLLDVAGGLRPDAADQLSGVARDLGESIRPEDEQGDHPDDEQLLQTWQRGLPSAGEPSR